MSHPSIVNKNDCVLVIIDIQERLLPAICNKDDVVKGTVRLIKGAAELGIPIILSEQYPKGLGGTTPEISEAVSEVEKNGAVVKRLEKTTFACTNTDSFLDILEELSRDQIILCGIETHICVTQTALGLIEQGFITYVVADAVGSRKAENIEFALKRLYQAGAIILPVESVLYEALVDSKTPEFKTICNIIK